MERLIERLAIARRALSTLREAIDRGLSDAIVRDAAIQRFEFTFEATWKAAQRFLLEAESLEVASPKGVIRASFQAGLLDDDLTRRALAMANDRNLTIHTYNEALAEQIGSHLPAHAQLIETWLAAIDARLAELNASDLPVRDPAAPPPQS
ncbi:Nucleotidyltransferase substrate binding protein like protein [compost metagenome]